MKTEEIIKDKDIVDFSPELDRGIDDMEAGRELPLDEALEMVDKLLESRKLARA